MRTCTRCGLAQDVAAFAARHADRGTLQSWCRACHREVAAERWRRLTAEQRAARSRADHARRAATRQRVWEILRLEACVDCGIADPLVLDFDHQRGKRANVSDLISAGATWAAVEAEIAKCLVRCGNCHRRRTLAGARDGRIAPVREPRAVTPRSSAPPADVPGGIRCDRCGRRRRPEDFAWRHRARGERQPWCRDCHNAHKRAFYAEHRQAEIERVARRRETITRENLLRIRAYLASHACTDCGGRDTRVLEFDHVGAKTRDVSTMVQSGMLWTTVERELSRCQVRCVNCHRRRTARQQGFGARKSGMAST